MTATGSVSQAAARAVVHVRGPGMAGPGTFCVDQDLYSFCLASLPANSTMVCEFDEPVRIACKATFSDGSSPAWSCRKEFGFLLLENITFSLPSTTTTTSRHGKAPRSHATSSQDAPAARPPRGCRRTSGAVAVAAAAGWGRDCRASWRCFSWWRLS
jgi:hypothetical protein